jgi:hypothetical protein
MTLHPYTFSSNRGIQTRSVVYFYLAIASVTLSSFFLNFLSHNTTVINFVNSINLSNDQLIRYSVSLSSPILLFTLLNFIFNQFLWKLPPVYWLPLVSDQPPDISGLYTGNVHWKRLNSSDPNNQEGNSNIKVLIEQTWSEIRVYFSVLDGVRIRYNQETQTQEEIPNPRSKDNTSTSVMAFIKPLPGSVNSFVLFYAYERRIGNSSQDEIDKGTSFLSFQDSFFTQENLTVTGNYYTDYGVKGEIYLGFEKSILDDKVEKLKEEYPILKGLLGFGRN